MMTLCAVEEEFRLILLSINSSQCSPGTSNDDNDDDDTFDDIGFGATMGSVTDSIN